MNAPDKLDTSPLTKTPLELAREAFPASRKTYIETERADLASPLRVPIRDVHLSNGEVVALYDTSGPYSDPSADLDVKRGLPDVRSPWIDARADTETYAARAHRAIDDGATHADRDAEHIAQLRIDAAALQRTPRRAKPGGNVTQMHYARRGIVTPEMEYVAIRENGRREWMQEYLADAEREKRLRGNPMGARIPEIITPEFVRDEVARGR